jgi:Family of unknown function (DUF5677)
MPEAPNLAILNREEASVLAAKHFGQQISLLHDLANYGSNLVLRAYASSKKDTADVLVCGVLLKQIVSMLDSIEVLLAAGIVHAGFLPARAAFEASIYLDWILFSDSDRKARCYVVANYRDERLWALRVIDGTPEKAAFDVAAADMGLDLHASLPTLAADATKHLAEVNRILAQEELQKIDQEFDQKRGKRKRDLDWYELVGAKSIRQVADAVDRLPEYDYFYSKGSQITHSAAYKNHIRFANNKVHLKAVRNLDDVDTLVKFVVAIGIRSFQRVLKHYRPGELPAFSKTYIADWRTPYMTVKSVKYDFS